MLRAIATGLIGVVLGIYLGRRGFDAAAIGFVVGSGLAGAATATLVVTLMSDRLGRKRALVILALLAAVGGALLVVAPNIGSACLVAFIGMVNGAGRDRAAALALEQAMLPQTVTDAARTRAFAWYNVLQDAGHAIGALGAALPMLIATAAATTEMVGYRWTFALYVALHLAIAALSLGLSPEVGAPRRQERSVPPLAPASRAALQRISLLFGIDSLAGGFLGAALLSYFFFERYGVAESTIATLFFVARLANMMSHLGAAWLAQRIGLVNTMVFTHIPSSLALLAIAFVSDFRVAAALFIARELLVEMDVPTRQSYVMAVVRPEERTFASGVTGLVRLGGWAVAPFVAGPLMQGVALVAPLLIGSSMKIGYDLLLWKTFRMLKPPEEQTRAPIPSG